MKLTVKNFRGVTDASIDINPIALIAGANGAGKSSIAQGAAAVLSGSPAPVAGFKKNQARQLLHDGTKTGNATLEGAKISFPGGSFTGEGPKASPVAAGLDHPLDMKPAESAKYLSGLLNAEPTEGDLREALPDVDGGTLSKIWAAIADRGWDAAHRQAKETGTKLKGQWEMVTGINYGTKVADGWVAPEFETNGVPELEALTAKLEKQRAEYDVLVGKKAVGADRIAQAQSYADMLPQLKKDLAKAEKSHIDLYEVVNQCETSLNEAVAAAQALPDPGDEVVTVDCPTCGDHLIVISNTKLISADDGPDQDDIKQQHDAIIEAGKVVSDARDALSDARKQLNENNDKLRGINQAITESEKAAEFIANANTDGSTDEEIETAQHSIDETQYLMSQLENMARAEKVQESIKQSAEIIAALAPEGVRKTVLSARLDEVNAAMASLCVTAKYPAVAMTEALTFTFGDRPFELLSESEQYRVRIISQLYAAGIDDSEIVIIDRADLLDSKGRAGLFKVVKATGKHALICMTISKREDVPALPAALGAAYWVENGVSERA